MDDEKQLSLVKLHFVNRWTLSHLLTADETVHHDDEEEDDDMIKIRFMFLSAC